MGRGAPVPGDDEIRALHERHAPSPEAFELVWTHSRIVWAIAAQFLHPGVDPDLVRAGCLLHDIGVHRLAPGEHYIRHGVLGEALLTELGYPPVLSRFCAHHTGVGLTSEDVLRQGLPLPPGDYTAGTPEEELVMYADKFHSKTTPPTFVTPAAYAAQAERFGAESRFAALLARYGEPDLAGLLSHDQG